MARNAVNVTEKAPSPIWVQAEGYRVTFTGENAPLVPGFCFIGGIGRFREIRSRRAS
jgi:hypothetical protein